MDNNRIRRQTVWLRLDDPPQILGYAARLDLPQDALSPAPAAIDTENPQAAPVDDRNPAPSS